MTKYTDDQVNEAIMLANQTGKVYVWETEMYRNVIKHLPKPRDYWQECSWGDVLHTDARVKAEYISGTVIEGIPDGVSDDGIYIVDGNFIPFSTDARWYRIPTPVVHPDPAEHPVIYAKDSDDIVNFVPKIMVWYRDSYVAGWQCLSPEQITDWQQIDPAKVVANND